MPEITWPHTVYLPSRKGAGLKQMKNWLSALSGDCERAIEADPAYALAHAALADTLALEAMYYPGAAADLRTAEQASARALQLAPDLGEVHSARGNVLFMAGRHAEAEVEFKEAIRRDPSLFDPRYFFARMCFQDGRLEEAARLFQEACRVREDYQAPFFAAQAMEAAGGRLMDVLVYYARALDRPLPDERPQTPVRLLRPEDAPGVGRVAAASFRGYLGHYHADPRLDRAKCDEVYLSWAERSCVDPSVASKVLVAEHAGEVAGFLTLLRRGAEEQEIVLNGVDPALQRHGIYRALVLAALREAQGDGARRLVVSTQLINLAPQKTWTRLGFEPAHAHYTFHLWLPTA